MKNTMDAVETGINILGVTIGITDINNIINLVLLIVSILAILIRGGLHIYQYIKDKQYDKAVDEIDKVVDNLNNLKEDKKDEPNK